MPVLLAIALILSSTHAFGASLPAGFRWCVSTSGHQIEGQNDASDWWAWEQAAGRIRSARATDHFNRVEEDQAILTDLGVSDLRLSIEWSRIEPQEGHFDPSAIEHYRRGIAGLRSRGIRPVITLQHFTLPQWLRAKGGFEWVGTPRAFAEFSRLVYREIAPGSVDWITINEPTITVMFGYLEGSHPPGEKRAFRDALPVLKGMATAHAAAYKALHQEAARAQQAVRVSIAHHLRTLDPWSTWNPLDRMIASVAHDAFNWGLIDALETGRLTLKVPGFISYDEEVADLRGSQDFIAVNYYSGDLLSFSIGKGFEKHSREDATKSDIGWDINPEGLTRLLVEVSQRYPRLPILITENGVADANDALRPQFLRDHVAAVAAAVNAGARVEGYCHWTLLDAFEWNEGFTPRFGLYSVDPVTFERRARPSARVYSEIIHKNGI